MDDINERFYEITLKQERTYTRIMKVSARGAAAARKRALELSRGDREPKEGEDLSEWCDPIAGRSKVHTYELWGKGEKDR